jgi:ppGpp synthetase/RelA/SpoT-type nucleotidyltranferase
VRDTLGSFADPRGYAFVARIKESESLAEKIESGRFEKWDALDDLFASALVVPTLGHEADVVTFLRDKFDVAEVRDRKSVQKDPASFRFDSTRVIARLPVEPSLQDDSPLRGVRFEVQVRTAFEHAWCVTTHALAYKADAVDWGQQRLASQLKAAVEQLDLLVLGFSDMASNVSTSSWPDVEAKKSIEDLFRQQLKGGAIPSEATPRSWARFCDNLMALIMAAQTGFVKGRDKLKIVEQALGAIEKELGAGGRYPKSLSLMQFCVGALCRQKAIDAKLHRYVPLVSRDLIDMFPESKVLGSGFDLQFP